MRVNNAAGVWYEVLGAPHIEPPPTVVRRLREVRAPWPPPTTWIVEKPFDLAES